MRTTRRRAEYMGRKILFEITDHTITAWEARSRTKLYINLSDLYGQMLRNHTVVIPYRKI